MNMYQKRAFAVFGLMAFAVIISIFPSLNGLVKLAAILTFVVAILTLKTTWQIIFTIFQLIGAIIGGTGHLVGTIGDRVASWSKHQKALLVTPVPGWEELVHMDDAPTHDALSEPEGPSFMDDVLVPQPS